MSELLRKLLSNRLILPLFLDSYQSCFYMVPKRGLEPPRPCDHYDLNVARLPFRHFGIYTNFWCRGELPEQVGIFSSHYEYRCIHSTSLKREPPIGARKLLITKNLLMTLSRLDSWCRGEELNLHSLAATTTSR